MKLRNDPPATMTWSTPTHWRNLSRSAADCAWLTGAALAEAIAAGVVDDDPERVRQPAETCLGLGQELMPPPPWRTMMTGAPSGPSTLCSGRCHRPLRTPVLLLCAVLRSHCVRPGPSRHGAGLPLARRARPNTWQVSFWGSRSSLVEKCETRSSATSTGSETEMKYIMIIAGTPSTAATALCAGRPGVHAARDSKMGR